MSDRRPVFEKKELALSSEPYVYRSTDLTAFAVEVTHAHEIDGDLLQEAVDRTLRRMPYLADTLQIEGGAVYYASNPLPMEVACMPWLRHVGGAETNYHMLDVTYDGRVTRFAMFHGFCDGKGLSAFLESVLHHYYCMRDGVDYDACGIRTDAEEMSPGEEFEPYGTTYEVSPDFQMPERRDEVAPYHLGELVPTTSDELRDWGLRLPSREFMDFVHACGTSPAVAVSMLVGEAIASVHPDIDAPVVAYVPISVRPMLGCEETFKNCASRAQLPIIGSPLDALPFERRAQALRGILRQQLDPNLRRAIMNMLATQHQRRMREATDYWEEVAKPDAISAVSHDTFYVDYIGRLHETAYSGQLVDMRFLCMPNENTLHLNMIEHDAHFLIDCLACSDVTSLVDVLGQALSAHGLPVDRAPERRFTLPRCAWREGFE